MVNPEGPRGIQEMVRVLREEIMVGFPDTPVFVQRGSPLGVDGQVAPGDQVIVRGGELLRGNEKVQAGGIFEEEDAPVRSAERRRN